VSGWDARVNAVRELVQVSGKRIDQVIDAVSESWGMQEFERAYLAHALSQPAAPAADPSVAQAARAAADAHEQEQRAADVLAFRQYQQARAQNPFVAAELRLANGGAIERGQALDTTDSEPPSAA
jgi:hypothetical protein